MPLSHSGWSAWISVDGEELPQYSVNIEEKPGSLPDVPTFYTVSCWIPSQAGKEFVINIDFDAQIEQKIRRTLELHVDGHFLLNKRYHQMSTFPHSIESMETEDNTERAFVFTMLNLTDEEVVEESTNLNKLGTIRLSIKRQELLYSIRRPPIDRTKQRRPPKALLTSPSVHETSKKAGCHRVLLGEPRQSKKPSTGPIHRSGMIRTYSNVDDGPFLTFIFHYRSADILRANEIMPLEVPVVMDPAAQGGESNPIEIEDSEESEPEPDPEVDNKIRSLETELESLKRRRTKKDSRNGFKRLKADPGDVKLVVKPEPEFIDLT
ncbi:hypothetical protein M422DRAFT_41929 [Sphaerobolus stellatus SS14]|nr:hypothetical protein M422DRAFT_41929 [Sphaerobolus stellatus SS14]